MSDTEPVVQEKKRGRAAAVKGNADKAAPVEEIKEPKKRGRAATAATTPATPVTPVKESKKDNIDSSITVEDNDEPSSKRGRGRPPKGVANKTTNKKKGKAIGGKKSGRGRPKRDETEDNKSDENEEEEDGEE